MGNIDFETTFADDGSLECIGYSERDDRNCSYRIGHDGCSSQLKTVSFPALYSPQADRFVSIG